MHWSGQRGNRPTLFSPRISMSHGWWSTVCRSSRGLSQRTGTCRVSDDMHSADKLLFCFRSADTHPKDAGKLCNNPEIAPCAGVPLEGEYLALQKFICVAIRDIPK